MLLLAARSALFLRPLSCLVPRNLDQLRTLIFSLSHICWAGCCVGIEFLQKDRRARSIDNIRRVNINSLRLSLSPRPRSICFSSDTGGGGKFDFNCNSIDGRKRQLTLWILQSRLLYDPCVCVLLSVGRVSFSFSCGTS